MITRLQDHYGGDQTKWMDMPSGVLFAYVRMVPVLRAEAAMRTAEVVALGSGAMSKEDSRRTTRRLRREAEPDVEAVREVDPEQRAMMIASVGIQIDG